jgi:glycosyltransferase involved in cell wall biosynthesis
MRVLHFYKTAFPDSMGGVEQFIHQIARGTQKIGITTDVLSLTSNKSAQTVKIDGYFAHRAKLDFHIASTSFSISAIFQFIKLAKNADIIHYHFPWPFMDMVHFLSRVKKPTIVTYHSDIIRQKYLLKFYLPLQHKFLTSVHRIVATSPNYVATSDILEKFSQKVTVIPIGLDKASYPTPEKSRLQHWTTRIGPKFFLFVGVIRYYKGLHILIEAAQRVNYPVVIVGAGPIEQELRTHAEQLDLHNIYFLGHLSDEDKSALLTLCYAMVFPSHLRSEAFGITLLEGAMYGKPMISSEIGTGTSYINIQGETGLIVPPSDSKALSEAMQYLWEHPEEAKLMGERAEERYKSHFTADIMVEKYAQLYAEMIK